MSRTRKVSVEVERELADIYLQHGQTAATAAACIAAGVGPYYARNAAHATGKGRPHWWVRNSQAPPERTTTLTANDPRWAWAIERGPVVA